MTRYAELKALAQKWRNLAKQIYKPQKVDTYDEARRLDDCADELEAALALPEDSKTVNAEDDGWPKLGKPARVGNTTFAPRVSSRLVVECAQRAYEYKLREASGEPMPYKVVRDGDKVRFE